MQELCSLGLHHHVGRIRVAWAHRVDDLVAWAEWHRLVPRVMCQVISYHSKLGGQIRLSRPPKVKNLSRITLTIGCRCFDEMHAQIRLLPSEPPTLAALACESSFRS